jgi:hypothetical protein
MSQYRDAEGNFIDTPIGNAHKNPALDPHPSPTATPNGSGTPLTIVQVTQNGVYMAVLSNPA